ncbi:hypothetical protein [Paenibacillus sacheonensis]|uniref:Uncharacterized protein n=1 Tax=Paenibacillus sacheonensis TaxID=742054 RepID=A0A7X4YXJ3_9BACL|nr:hypothetical protein [Paenibacillus sacheonensis]MBM7564336.1 hypothetical protein [Paenibacillus sacheonensis]NBC73434.1 hypothetical protein [Paenibacillus sacheonensis]
MYIVILSLCIVCVIVADYREGVRDGPRPSRTKLTYGLLLALALYHMADATGLIHVMTYYDTANALFGPAADALFKWFKLRG